jgi:perosamine synthetase
MIPVKRTRRLLPRQTNGAVAIAAPVADAEGGMHVPFFRADLGDDEIKEVIACLRSGWLTTGPRARQFEADFARRVGAKHAVAVNSCTAALHLAVESLDLRPGQAVLVPTMTFAATAEVVRYQGAVPILVDCDATTLNMDLADAERKLQAYRRGKLSAAPGAKVTGMIAVHVGGLMMDVEALHAFSRRHGLWLVEDAAHALPAAWRRGPAHRWRQCGQNTAAVTCFSFYANKTITTGEGGMAVTDDARRADHLRQMSLHGLSHDAWDRYRGSGSWDYRIIAPGYKYNLTDIAAAIGIHQLRRAEALRERREAIARAYRRELAGIVQLELPPAPADRIHAWHLFPIRLRLERLSVDRNEFFQRLHRRGVCCSVHWRPLHLHPYYQRNFGWMAGEFPVATAEWRRLISLPIYPSMTGEEQGHVIRQVRALCEEYGTT